MDRFRKLGSYQNLELARHSMKVLKPEIAPGAWERASRCPRLSSALWVNLGRLVLEAEQREAGAAPRLVPRAGMEGGIYLRPKQPSFERTAVGSVLRPGKQCQAICP